MATAMAPARNGNHSPAQQQNGGSPVIGELANKFGLTAQAFVAAYRKVVFKGDNVSNEDFAASLVLVKDYGLNPFAKQIFTIPNKGAMICVVSVDGWAKIVNDHPQYDGCDFEFSHYDNGNIEACTCTIYRKDRSRPIKVTEYLDECFMEKREPWEKWPRRMLRHKAFIQAARLAFNLSGIYDPDEGERITGHAIDVSVAPQQQFSPSPTPKQMTTSLHAMGNQEEEEQPKVRQRRTRQVNRQQQEPAPQQEPTPEPQAASAEVVNDDGEIVEEEYEYYDEDGNVISAEEAAEYEVVDDDSEEGLELNGE